MSELTDAATALVDLLEQRTDDFFGVHVRPHPAVTRLRAALAADAQRSAHPDIVAKRVEPNEWEVVAPWGTLAVSRGEIFGLQNLWLPNVSLSPSMARDLAYQLNLAAQSAYLKEEQ